MPDLPPPVVHAAAPLRIDLAGSGGLPALALSRPAATLTIPLDLAARAEVRLGGRAIRLRATEPEQHLTVSAPSDLVYNGVLDEHKAALNMLPVTGGLELLTWNTARAPGLGTPAATNVAMLAALAQCRRERYDGEELADLAVTLQRTELGRRVGRLDAWSAALGGPRVLVTEDERVSTQVVPEGAVATLVNHRLVLVALDRSRCGGIRQGAVVRRLAAGDPEVKDAVHRLEEHVPRAAAALTSGSWSILEDCVREAWEAQRRLDPVLAAAPMSGLVAALRSAGATAWKVTSGRSGGTLMVLGDPSRRADVSAAAAAAGGAVLPARSGAGVRVWQEEVPSP